MSEQTIIGDKLESESRLHNDVEDEFWIDRFDSQYPYASQNYVNRVIEAMKKKDAERDEKIAGLEAKIEEWMKHM